MTDTFTSNLNLTKPAVGSSSNTWGGKLNANLDAVDAKFAGTSGSVVLRNANSQSVIAGMRPDSASGTDQAGTDVNIAAGSSTGNAAGGNLNLQTAPASGSSGNAVNAPTTRVSVLTNGNVTMTNDLAVTGAISCATLTIGGLAPDTFPSGTRMVFQQTNAPTGWTKSTDSGFNNAVFRVVTGSVGSTTDKSGGSVAFTNVFQSVTPAGSVATSITGSIDGHAITVSQMPAHRHFIAANITNNNTTLLSASNQAKRGGHTELASNNNEDYHLGGVATDATVGRTSSKGSGNTHTHGISGLGASSAFTGTAIDFDVKYVDIIVAQKD